MKILYSRDRDRAIYHGESIEDFKSQWWTFHSIYSGKSNKILVYQDKTVSNQLREFYPSVFPHYEVVEDEFTHEEKGELKRLKGIVEVLGVSEMTENQYQRYIILQKKEMTEK